MPARHDTPALVLDGASVPTALDPCAPRSGGGRVLLVTDRAQRVTLVGRGLDGSDVTLRPGMRASALFAHASRGAAEAAISDALGGADRVAIEAVTLAADGAPIWLRAEPVRDFRGAVVGACLLAEDGPAAPPDPERLADVARGQRREALGLLTLGIAHDFANLVSVISAASESLDRSGELCGNEDAVEDVAAIRAATARAHALVRHLLTFGGGAERRTGRLEIDAALSDVGALLRRLWRGKAVLVLDLGAPGCAVRADPTEFDQIILNLAMNARDAMLDGGTLTVRSRPECDGAGDPGPGGAGVVVEVIDTGIGIAPEFLGRIFDPFFTTKRARGGSGLGLATVASLLRRVGATIAAESTIGTGTCFRLVFPQAGALDDDVHAAEATSPGSVQRGARPSVAPVPLGPAGQATAVQRGAVLLVDDDDLIRRLATRALARHGWHVLAAPSGERALELLATSPGPVQAVVTDLAMPGMDGHAVIDAVRARLGAPGLPCVIASGYRSSRKHGSTGESTAARGRTFTLEKPYSPSRLIELLDELTDRSGAVVEQPGRRLPV